MGSNLPSLHFLAQVCQKKDKKQAATTIIISLPVLTFDSVSKV